MVEESPSSVPVPPNASLAKFVPNTIGLRGIQGPGRQGNASGEARFEQRATGHTVERWGTCLSRAILWKHRDSSL